MGIKTYLYKTVFAISLIAVNPALADDMAVPQHFIGQYLFNWTGIPLGTLVLGIDQTQDSYRVHVTVSSQGIVNLFTRHMSDTVATGKRIGSTYLPQFYECYYKTKKKPRHVRLTFDDKGAVKEEFNEPPEDPTDRPVVPHSLKDGAVDPLTMLLKLLSGEKDFSVFDAKRLYRLHARESDHATFYIEKRWRKTMSLILSRAPLGGLTAKEMKEYEKGEPPLTFYISDDKDHIPLGVSINLMFGPVEGVLVKECSAWDECAVPVDAK